MYHSSVRRTLATLLALLLVGVLIGGCVPRPTVTAIPPATLMVGPVQPSVGVSASTAGPPLKPTAAAPQVAQATQVPAAQPTVAAAEAPSVAPTRVVPTLQIEPHKPVKLTLLHTNDVFGEIDPCG